VSTPWIHRFACSQSNRDITHESDDPVKKLLLSLVAILTIAAPLSLAATPAEAATHSQQQAIGTAKDYLRYQSFSKLGLVDQLKYEGFSRATATYAVNHIRVSWKNQAVKTAESYLEFTHFSRSGLIEQLEYEKFTHAQAVYGVKRAY